MEKNEDLAADPSASKERNQKGRSRNITIAYYIIAIIAVVVAAVGLSLYFLGHSSNSLYLLLSGNKVFGINSLSNATAQKLSGISKLNVTFSGTVSVTTVNGTELLYSSVLDLQKYYNSSYIRENISSRYLNASVFMVFNSSTKYLCTRVGNSTLSCHNTIINITFADELLSLFYNTSAFGMGNKTISMQIESLKDSNYNSMPCVLVKAHGSINASIGLNLTTCISEEYYLPLNVTYIETAQLGKLTESTYETSLSSNARSPMSYLPANSIV